MQQYTNATGTGARDGAGTSSAVTVQAKELARAGTEQAKQIGETAKARALREMESKREKIAGEVEKLAGVLEKQETEGEVSSPIVGLAARATRSLATTLQDRSAEEILQDVRRSPVAILAGSFAIGFVAFRLLKS
jgi:hypothetical protein